MHNAPAVSFPVGRSHLQGWLVGLTTLVSGVAGLTWWVQVDVAGWRQALFGLSGLVTGTLAMTMWHRAQQGTLCWDGQAWRWAGNTSTACGTLTVHLDLQFAMLLSLRTDVGALLWIWPEQKNSKERWRDLRRAVFSKRGATQVHDADIEFPLRPGAT